MQQRLAPFVVEPGAAGDGKRLAVQAQRAAHRQLRLAQIVAGLCRIGALARVAGLALQQHRLGGGELQVEREISRGRVELRLVGMPADAAAAHQPPAAQAHIGVGRRCLGDAEAGAGDARVVAQALLPQVGHRGMSEQHLARGEAAGVIGGYVGARAKERELESIRVTRSRRVEPTGHVPPLGAELGMAAEVARQRDRHTRPHDRLRRCLALPRRQRGREQQRTPRQAHQSSFTASTASRDAARRAAIAAVTVPAATTAAHSSANRPHGARSSMVQ